MDNNFLEIAKKAALEAGKAILRVRKGEQNVKQKSHVTDLVTRADLDADKIIIATILKIFPQHNILSEEKGRINNESRFTWVIDPLDGTSSFVAGINNFAVSISLLKDNQPILGVINWVSTGELFWAEEGKGAFVNGKKIQISKVSKLSESSFDFEYGKALHREYKNDHFFLPLFKKIRYPFVLGSSAVALVLVGKGVLEGFVTQANRWDFAGGVRIVLEAGGKVTDPAGQPLDWTKDRLDVVASNGLIHEAILEALKE